MTLRKNYLCDFRRQMYDKNEHENILTNNLQHEPVLKTVVYTFYCLKSIYMYIHQNETLCF